MNTAVLSGAISAPKLGYTQNNKPICEFELSFINPSKSESIKTIKCFAFGKNAENFGQLPQSLNVVLIGSVNIKKQDGIYTPEFLVTSLDIVPNPINVNTINIVGRTGQNTDIKYFESGSNKATNSLAVRRMKETDWFSLEAWGKTAEVMANYVRKGGLIGVSGQIKIEEWKDRNSGDLRSKLIVDVKELQLLDSKSQEQDTDF